MATYRYLRIISLEAFERGDLEIAELQFGNANARVDTGATITTTLSPSSGAIANIGDADTGTTARWAAADVKSPGFAIRWDFGTATTFTQMRIASPVFARACDQFTLQGSTTGADGSWVTLQICEAIPHAGDGTLSAWLPVAEQNFSSNALVLSMNSANGSTRFHDASLNRCVVQSVGGAQISTAQSKFGGASLLLNGTTSYANVSSASTAALKPATSTTPITAECWAYATATPNGSAILSEEYPATGQVGYTLSFGTSIGTAGGANPCFGAFNGSAWAGASGALPLPVGRWVHLAGVYDGATYSVFMDGVLIGVSALGQTIPTNAFENFFIGRRWDLNGTQTYFAGYVDDVRITNGLARYSPNFTAPASELVLSGDAYAGNASTDTELTGTVLLLNMNGGNGQTTFADSSPYARAVTVNGNAQISTAQSKFGGASGYFSGSDYLVVTSSAMDIAQTDFTVEAWIYPTDGNGAAGSRTIFHFNAGTTNFGLHVHRNNSGFLVVDNGSVGTTAGNVLIPLNQWTHVAATRSGSTIRGFVNGVQCLTHTAQSYGNATQLQLGRYWAGTTTGNLFGYIDDVRITSGVARYTAAFTPPAAEFTAPSPYVALLLNANGSNGSTSFTDSSTAGHTIAALGNAQISTAQSKFGGSSALFDGTGDYLTINSSPMFNLGALDFTVEAWVYPTNASAGANFGGNLYQNIVGNHQFGVSSNACFALNLFNMRPQGGIFSGGAVVAATSISATNALTVNQWAHIVYQRRGNTFTLYVNGTLSAIGTSTARADDSTRVLAIGADSTGNGTFQGYIDDLRITRGFARYPAAFTPPTEQFSAFEAPVLAMRSNDSITGTRGVTTLIGIQAYRDPMPRYPFARDIYWGGLGKITGTVFDLVPAEENAASVSLLLNMNGANGSTTFTDSSSAALTVTANGNAQISTAQSKFGGASALFDGTGDWLSLPSNAALNVGTGNFTLEMWVRPTTIGSDRNLFKRYDSATSNGAAINSSNKFSWWKDGTGAILTSTTNAATDTWFHVAYVRSGTAFTLYINGVSESTTTNSDAFNFSSWDIGRGYYNLTFSGYIDDFRLTKGVARYTANFTPPAAEFAVTATPVPAYRRVRLMRYRDGAFIREQWTNPTTGAYEFREIDPTVTYTVLSYDHTGTFRAAVADNVTPAPM